MRGKISDQDLTDYALNALDAEERLFVESMLAVSDECRNDVCEMIDLGQMLEEGHEQELAPDLTSLTAEQRQALLSVKPRSPLVPFIQQAAALVGLAACVTFALVTYSRWEAEGTANRVAQVSSQVSKVVAQVVTAPQTSAALSQSFVNLRTFVEDPATWIPDTSMICTPPTWSESEAMASITMPDVGDIAY